MTKAKTRLCPHCNKNLSIKLFFSYRRNGVMEYSDTCKSCDPRKICLICNQKQMLTCFRSRQKQNKTTYESICLVCEKWYNKISCSKYYKEKGRSKFIERYYGDDYFRQEKLNYSRDWEIENKSYRRKYRKQEHQRQRAAAWFKEKRKNDFVFRLRTNISNSINTYIKSNKGDSCLGYLPYTIAELKTHIENQFEYWMNWDNWGVYNAKTWDDDSSTWTWQIDHIVPQSDLPYDSMNHPNFKKCWALSNLRPLSAKQNVIDGVKKRRHRKQNTYSL